MKVSEKCAEQPVVREWWEDRLGLNNCLLRIWRFPKCAKQPIVRNWKQDGLSLTNCLLKKWNLLTMSPLKCQGATIHTTLQ